MNADGIDQAFGSRLGVHRQALERGHLGLQGAQGQAAHDKSQRKDDDRPQQQTKHYPALRVARTHRAHRYLQRPTCEFDSAGRNGAC